MNGVGDYLDKASQRLTPSRTDSQGRVLAYRIPDEQLLMRFLIMGSEVGNFYATAHELTERNIECVARLIASGQGEGVVERVVEVVRKGRCIRMNTALLVLALCCRSNDPKTKLAAYKAVVEVCNIPTHLFMFIKHMKSQKGKTAGWGRSLRKVVTLWYNQFTDNPQRLAMLVTKYQQREGWSHSDLLRLSHAKPANDLVGFILRYVRHGLEEARKFYLEDGACDMQDARLRQIVTYLQAVEEVKTLQAPKRPEKIKDVEMRDENDDGKDDNVEEMDQEDDSAVQRVVALVQQFDLLREQLPTAMLRFTSVWESLLKEMPMMAMIRNLNKMTMIGLLDRPDQLALVLNKMGNKEALRMSKVHPYSILVAWYTYSQGWSHKGKLTWEPVPEVVDALEQAFYASFGNVQPTNKRILIAVDVSQSMYHAFATPPGVYSPVRARDAAAAMSLVTFNVEACVDVVGFTADLTPIPLEKGTSLKQAIKEFKKLVAGMTDCSQPMLWATEKKKEYDAFIIYTDCETWYSSVPPAEALRVYRKESGIENARLAAVAMSTGNFTLSDPEDVNMLDVIGFDTDTPSILQHFIEGSIVE
ncbi:hypothetical protein ACOMHN_052272 [Nucella lapillus]